jgi:hypothetical protein
MIISFQTKELHDCSYIAAVAEEKLGNVLAQALATLISDAEAAETAQELLELYNPAALLDTMDSLFVDLGAECHARFVAVGHEFSRDEEGRTVWASVRRLKLVALEPA